MADRILISTFLALAIAAGIVWFYTPDRPVDGDRKQTDAPLDIFMISAGGLRAGHITSYLYQHNQTPGIDFLAYDGIRFLNAYTTSTHAFAAHLSAITGLYPFSNDSTRIRGKKMPALTRLLRDRGYVTAAYISDPELADNQILPKLFHQVSFNESITDVTTSATAWLSSSQSAPVFLLINFVEPANPFQPPPPYDRQYRTHPYDGEIAAVDHELAKFVNFLKQTGRFKRSVVVFFSSYGETLNKDSRVAGISKSVTHVPLTIAAPAILPARLEYHAPVSLVDITPTIGALLQLQLDWQTHGEPLFKMGSSDEITRNGVLGSNPWPASLGLAPLFFLATNRAYVTTEFNPVHPSLTAELKRFEVEFSSDRDKAKSAELADLETSIMRARIHGEKPPGFPAAGQTPAFVGFFHPD